MQDATVNASTSLRTKKRGKVPPRLETLFVNVSQEISLRHEEGGKGKERT